MKIKYNSLLNRFNRYMAGDSHTNPFSKRYKFFYTDEYGCKDMNICEYFWRTVWNVIKAVMGITLATTAFIVLVGVPIFSWIALIIGSVSEEMKDVVIVGLVLTLAYLFILCCVAYHYFKTPVGNFFKKIFRSNKPRKEKVKKDSLIKEFYLAKKNKFCKMVEIEHD